MSINGVGFDLSYFVLTYEFNRWTVFEIIFVSVGRTKPFKLLQAYVFELIYFVTSAFCLDTAYSSDSLVNVA